MGAMRGKILNKIGLGTLILLVIIIAGQISFIMILESQKTKLMENMEYTYLFDENNSNNIFVGIEWSPSYEKLLIGSANGSLHFYDSSLTPTQVIIPNLDILVLIDFCWISNEDLVFIYLNFDRQILASSFNIVNLEILHTTILIQTSEGKYSNVFFDSNWDIMGVVISYSVIKFYSLSNLFHYSTFNISSHFFNNNRSALIEYHPEFRDVLFLNDSIAQVLYCSSAKSHCNLFSVNVVSQQIMDAIEINQAIYSILWAATELRIVNNVTHLNIFDSEYNLLHSMHPREVGLYLKMYFMPTMDLEMSSNTLITNSKVGNSITSFSYSFDLWKFIEQDPYLTEICHIKSEGHFSKILSAKEGMILGLENSVAPERGDRILIILLPMSFKNMNIFSTKIINLIKLIFVLSTLLIIIIVGIRRYYQLQKKKSIALYPDVEYYSR